MPKELYYYISSVTNYEVLKWFLDYYNTNYSHQYIKTQGECLPVCDTITSDLKNEPDNRVLIYKKYLYYEVCLLASEYIDKAFKTLIVLNKLSGTSNKEIRQIAPTHSFMDYYNALTKELQSKIDIVDLEIKIEAHKSAFVDLRYADSSYKNSKEYDLVFLVELSNKLNSLIIEEMNKQKLPLVQNDYTINPLTLKDREFIEYRPIKNSTITGEKIPDVFHETDEMLEHISKNQDNQFSQTYLSLYAKSEALFAFFYANIEYINKYGMLYFEQLDEAYAWARMQRNNVDKYSSLEEIYKNYIYYEGIHLIIEYIEQVLKLLLIIDKGYTYNQLAKKNFGHSLINLFDALDESEQQTIYRGTIKGLTESSFDGDMTNFKKSYLGKQFRYLQHNTQVQHDDSYSPTSKEQKSKISCETYIDMMILRGELNLFRMEETEEEKKSTIDRIVEFLKIEQKKMIKLITVYEQAGYKVNDTIVYFGLTARDSEDKLRKIVEKALYLESFYINEISKKESPPVQEPVTFSEFKQNLKDISNAFTETRYPEVGHFNFMHKYSMRYLMKMRSVLEFILISKIKTKKVSHINEVTNEDITSKRYLTIEIDNEEYTIEEIIQFKKFLDDIKKMLPAINDSNQREKEIFTYVYYYLGRSIEFDEHFSQYVRQNSKNMTDRLAAIKRYNNAVSLRGITTKKSSFLGFSKILREVLHEFGISSNILRTNQNTEGDEISWNQVYLDGVWYNCNLGRDSIFIKKDLNCVAFLKSTQDFLNEFDLKNLNLADSEQTTKTITEEEQKSLIEHCLPYINYIFNMSQKQEEHNKKRIN